MDYVLGSHGSESPAWPADPFLWVCVKRRENEFGLAPREVDLAARAGSQGSFPLWLPLAAQMPCIHALPQRRRARRRNPGRPRRPDPDASLDHALGAKLGSKRPAPLSARAALGTNRGMTDRALLVDVGSDNVASRSGE